MVSRIVKGLVALLLIIPIFAGIKIVYGETDVGANLITDVSIVNGNDEKVTTLDQDESFKIELDWSLAGVDDLKAGDKATITLPVEIEGVNNTYQLYDENNDLVVNVTQVGNQLTFVFTDFVEQNENVHGNFYFWTKFSDNIAVDQTNQLDFETVNGTKTIPIFIRGVDDSGGGALLTKQGLYLGTQNPKRTIDWRVYINSYDTNKVTIQDGKFVDTLGPHQTLVSSTARVVYGPSVSNPTFVEDVLITLNPDGTFVIPLRDTNERIYITYKTVTDGTLEQYTNRGTLQALINNSEQVHSITGYTTKYGGGGSGTGETGSSSETTSSSESSESTTSSSSSSEGTTSSSESSESTTSSSESSESTTSSSSSSESTTSSSSSSESTTSSSSSSESTTSSSSSGESTTSSSSSSESTTSSSSSSESTTSSSSSSESTTSSSSSSESTTPSSSSSESTTSNSKSSESTSSPSALGRSGDSSTGGQKQQLPQTGMTSDKWMILGGMLLISFVIYKRK
jgi:LPXTG-motif cell wall-anchored protein